MRKKDNEKEHLPEEMRLKVEKIEKCEYKVLGNTLLAYVSGAASVLGLLISADTYLNSSACTPTERLIKFVTNALFVSITAHGFIKSSLQSHENAKEADALREEVDTYKKVHNL